MGVNDIPERLVNILACPTCRGDLKQGKSKEAIVSFEKAIEAKPSYYLKASENLKLAKMSLANQNTQGVATPVTLTQTEQELKPLRLRLDTMLSTQIGARP